MRPGNGAFVILLILLPAPAVIAQPAAPPALTSPFAAPAAPFIDDNVFKPQPAPPPKGAPPPKPWTGAFEFGLNGSEGNSDVLKIRLGGNVKRCTDTSVFTADLFYGLARQDDVLNENKALANARDELYLWKGSPWSVFVSGQMEYDEFRAYDFRVGAYSGLSYQCVKTDAMSWKCRLGAGFTREVGGPEDRWVPEGLVGTTFDYQLTKQQRFLTAVDVYPSMTHINHVRVRSFAAYEIVLNPEWNLALRLGIQDRYDSRPGPAKPNDVDYFSTLLLKF